MKEHVEQLIHICPSRPLRLQMGNMQRLGCIQYLYNLYIYIYIVCACVYIQITIYIIVYA